MKILNKFSNEDINLLKKINIIITDEDYTDEEIIELEEKVSDHVVSNRDKNDELTEEAKRYEKIVDIISEL